MIGSFDLHLRAEHKSPKTITVYTDAATWFASASLVPAGLTEECFQAGKNEAGLDHYQIRLYGAWYRYVTLAMLALAWFAVTRAALADDDVILASSANEIRRMFAALSSPPLDEQHARRWSRWRHHHQERARHHHYQRQRLKDH